MKKYKKITIEKFLKILWNPKKYNKKRTIKVYNKKGSKCATISTLREDVFFNINGTLSNFEDGMFYMRRDKIFYIKS